MKLFLLTIIWLLVFAFSPLVAIAAIVIFPIVWIVALPFRLLGLAVDGAFQFVHAMLLLPTRLLGMRPQPK